MNRLLAPLSAIALLVQAPLASAQNLCLPEANGVPYTSSAPPQWTTPATSTPEDDPGWVGSTQSGHGLAADHAIVRAIKDGNDLFFSFQSRIPLDSATQGEVWIGISDGTDHKVFHLTIAHSTIPPANGDAIECLVASSPPPNCNSNAVGNYRILESTGTNPPAESEAASQAALPWANQFGRVWQRADGFVVNVRIPDGVLGLSTATGPFSFWYQFALRQVAGSNLFPLANWPSTASSANYVTVLPGLLNPPTSEWGTLELGTTGAGCRQGVLIERANFGIAHGTAGAAKTNRIVGLDGAGAPVDNHFVATPTHSGGGAVPTTLEARFRIADWGSHPPTAPGVWTSVHTKLGGGSEWVALSGSDFVQGPWTLNATQRCEYNIPKTTAPADDCTGITARTHHQCILAEIRATAGGDAGPTLPILKDSVYKNTNFVNLSEFSRIASIGAQGLNAPSGASQVPMYLHVTTRNMPGRYNAPTNPRDEVVARLKAVAAEITQRFSPEPRRAAQLRARAERGEQRAAALLKRLTAEAAAAMPRETKALLATIQTGLQSNDPAAVVQNLPSGVVEAVMPSMIVYVAHASDTEVERPDKSKFVVLVPQGAFGYYAQHDGPIVGWQAVIDGARRIGASNWYKLDVPPDGVARINTRIQARETDAEAAIEPDPNWKPPVTGSGGGPKPDTGNGGAGGGNGCCKCEIASLGDAASHGILVLMALVLGLARCRRRRL